MTGVVVGWFIIGFAAGWLTGTVVGGGGFGIVWDIVVGMVGAIIAGWIALHVAGGSGHGATNGGYAWSLLIAFLGSVVLLFIFRAIFGARRTAV